MEFTTTACNRPEILERTYQSFTSRLLNTDFSRSTLYINIDPSPNTTNIHKVENIAKRYFGTVVANYPQEANFAKAIIWCFTQPKGPYFFHLEDDWILNSKINIHSMINILESDPDIHQVILQQKNVQQPNEPTFLPSLHKTIISKLFIPHMSPNINPEAQFKKLFRLWKSQRRVRFKYHILGRGLVTDIGREWLKRKGIRRDYNRTRRFSRNSGWTPWISWDTSKSIKN